MTTALIAALHAEERAIIAELRASVPFQRMEGIQRLLSLYGALPSIAVTIDAPAQGLLDGPAAPAVPNAAPAVSAAIMLPGSAGATAEAAVAEAARPKPAPVAAPATEAMSEPASVVSSVRAALLGIGKS